MCTCVCVCKYDIKQHTHTHTHSHAGFHDCKLWYQKSPTKITPRGWWYIYDGIWNLFHSIGKEILFTLQFEHYLHYNRRLASGPDLLPNARSDSPHAHTRSPHLRERNAALDNPHSKLFCQSSGKSKEMHEAVTFSYRCQDLANLFSKLRILERKNTNQVAN